MFNVSLQFEEKASARSNNYVVILWQTKLY